MSTPASYHMQFSDKLNEIENETNKFASNISTHEESLEKSMNKTGTYFTKLKSLNKEQLKDHFGMKHLEFMKELQNEMEVMGNKMKIMGNKMG
ncbi:hypothetical protein RhiirA4_452328 [Rhizophagus irregularis]|uniref:Uncharacterized protein n=1 Tax=Rhizophagus irregularis TaxID=588596 RepID=A0A2I1FXR3_9GLOM|nr:hypothetical protein RhiirA4_452328 [Rhizophagus irregularis]